MGKQGFVEAPPLDAPIIRPNEASKPSSPPIVTPQEPSKTEAKVEAPVVKSADILVRGTKPIEDNPKPQETTETNYRQDLEKITDPSVRAIAEKAIKDFESGYNKKYESLALQRKDLDARLQQISTWTPQRLQEELRKPEFVQAIQSLQQTAPPNGWEGSTDEWSALSPSEKQQFASLKQETQSLQSQMAKMQQEREDIEVSKLYPDYDPKIVDEAVEGLRTGRINASRADIWKVVNHDKNVEKGYQVGYEDGYKKAVEKLNGSSILPQNGNVTSADEVPEEVRKGGFSSIALWRLSKMRGAKK